MPESDEAGHPDWSLDFAHILRATLAQRMARPDGRIANNGSVDQGDALFQRGDFIAKRIDWLGELNLRYRQRHGLRLSATAWVDGAYGNQGRANPAAQPSASPSYAGNVFTHYVQRYYRGPSGEFLDAFAFTSLDAGESVWNLKLGRHAVVWGESMFGTGHAIAYAQTPSDGLKSIANPGASAKETSLPIHQLSLVAQINPELSLLGQYLFEWRANRIPEGGTYFGVADTVLEAPNVNRLSALTGRRGDWGIGLRWTPTWLDGTLGLYARRFDDKAGWLTQVAGGGVTRTVYAKGIGLWGVSLAKNVAGVSMGAELSYRLNGPLVSDPATSVPGTLEGARGNTWHGLLNGVLALGPTHFYDSATLSAELAWSRLDKLTRNPAYYRANGRLALCNTNATLKGCTQGEYASLSLLFTPVWLQVLPGVDMEMPFFYSVGLRGNAPSNGGGSEGFATWKLGISARIYVQHKLDLAYTGYSQKLQNDASTPYGSRILGAPYRDKGWLSLTYQVFF